MINMSLSRREFTKFGCRVIIGAVAGSAVVESIVTNGSAAKDPPPAEYDWNKHYWGYVIDTRKCIGCGRCARACKLENHVPFDEPVYRTWVERYRVLKEGEVKIDSPNGSIDGFTDDIPDDEIKKAFYVPKICNHCDSPPCVQVCPVGATYETKDGVVLVDYDYCIGCRYCIQACPYGARFLHPVTHTAEKCTFCYHRLVKELTPACVEVCPTQARIFGDLKERASPLSRFRRMNEIQVLKAHLNTEPKVFYANLDGEVR